MARPSVGETSWDDVKHASARRHEEEKSPPPAVTGDRWERIRSEARALAPGMFGYLLWVEKCCVDGGLHPMDRQWIWHFEQFYESGKFIDLGRGGLRSAKSASVCRAITAESLMIERRLEPSIVGVCPVISSKISEANDRFDTIIAILRACGFRDLAGKRSPETEHFTFIASGGGSQARVISLLDSQGHSIKFQIQPANEASAAGFTGIAGFGDELDLWGKLTGANPAAKVVEILVTRYTTQPEAKLHLWSATYDRKSHHAAMISDGDTPLQRVARLGIDGAVKDMNDRQRLARIIKSTDPDLLAMSDPNSTDIPTWVSNPVAPIEDCYAKSGSLRRMFALYGGRPDLSGGGDGAGQCALAASINARLARRLGKTKAPIAGQANVHVPFPGEEDYPPPRHRRATSWRTRKAF